MVELAFRHPNLPDLLQKVVEVFLGKYTTPVFQPVTVHGPALNGVVLNDGIGPLAELDRPVIVDLESNRNDHLQIVVLHLAANLTGALSLNYPEIPDSCLLCQLTILIDLLDVLIDCPNIHIIESRHHLLGQPDILILIAHFHALCTVTGSGHKGQVFRCAGSDRLFLFIVPHCNAFFLLYQFHIGPAVSELRLLPPV